MSHWDRKRGLAFPLFQTAIGFNCDAVAWCPNRNQNSFALGYKMDTQWDTF
jgi:hypothetical protein